MVLPTPPESPLRITGQMYNEYQLPPITTLEGYLPKKSSGPPLVSLPSTGRVDAPSKKRKRSVDENDVEKRHQRARIDSLSRAEPLPLNPVFSDNNHTPLLDNGRHWQSYEPTSPSRSPSRRDVRNVARHGATRSTSDLPPSTYQPGPAYRYTYAEASPQTSPTTAYYPRVPEPAIARSISSTQPSYHANSIGSRQTLHKQELYDRKPFDPGIYPTLGSTNAPQNRPKPSTLLPPYDPVEFRDSATVPSSLAPPPVAPAPPPVVPSRPPSSYDATRTQQLYHYSSRLPLTPAYGQNPVPPPILPPPDREHVARWPEVARVHERRPLNPEAQPFNPHAPYYTRRADVPTNQYTWEVPGIAGGHNQRRRRGNLPKESTAILNTWYAAHSNYPYPKEDEKQQLQAQTGLTMSQISNWFINARRRRRPGPAATAGGPQPYTSFAPRVPGRRSRSC